MHKTSPALVAALFVLALLPAAASSSVAGITVLKTRGHVNQIAADGNRVAATTNCSVGDATRSKCDRIFVWNPVKKALTMIIAGAPVDAVISYVSDLTLAGNRVAWLEATGGNELELTVSSRVIGAKKTVGIAYAANENGAEMQPDGDYVGNVAGDGSLIAYNAWHVCTAVPVGGEDDLATCHEPAPGDDEVLDFSEQQLLKVVGKNGVEIASAPDAQDAAETSLAVVSVDAGRIAIQAPSGPVTLYAATGKVLKQIPVPAGDFSGTALQGSQLVTLRNDKIELYDVTTGALVKKIPVAAGSVLRDLQNGLAVYVNGRKVRVLRLSDGKRLTFSPPGKGSVDAQIEAPGLFYSYNFKSGRHLGRIVFLPSAKLWQKLG